LYTDYTDPDNIFTINVINNGYTNGMTWDFKTYPYNKDVELDNYSIPIVTDSGININITETVIK